ncbi:hypothetical protein [Agromyces humi]|uniref:hypothetical protein n=1 Tax=Agromyces humi TaxID=1766800 RepID=UPI001356F7E4|nr:hypothetical protein [Agromyces humi]
MTDTAELSRTRTKIDLVGSFDNLVSFIGEPETFDVRTQVHLADAFAQMEQAKQRRIGNLLELASQTSDAAVKARLQRIAAELLGVEGVAP